MEINLRKFREKALNLSQQEFADRLGVTQNTVSRWESDPEALPVSKLRDIASTFGVQITDILQQSYVVNEPWKAPGNAWLETAKELNSLNNQIDVTRAALDNTDYSQFSIYRNYGQKKIGVLKSIRLHGKKPAVAFTGASDAGKSTMINVLLGDETLPAKWTPTTSAGTKLVHVMDKPSFMNGHTTGVFRTEIDEPLIDTAMLNDEDYFNNHLVQMGSRSLIIEFGTHEGDGFKQNRGNKEYLYTIVTYIDAPILEQCEIWDVPGVEASSKEDLSDDFVANASKQGADIMIYLSVSNQFMHNFDMQYLKEAIDTLPRFDIADSRIQPFENLFIVASQAAIVASNSTDNDIKEVIRKRIAEFGNTLPDNYWKQLSANAGMDINNSSQYSLEDIQKRAFTFERENNKLQRDFKDSFLNLLEKLSVFKKSDLKESGKNLKDAYNQTLSADVRKLENYIEDSEKAKQVYEKFKINKPILQRRNEDMVKLMKSKAIQYKENSHRRISEYFDTQVTVDNIQNLITQKGYGKNKEGREQFITWFQNEVAAKSESIIRENSKSYARDINDQLELYEKDSIKLNISSFNYAAKFIGVLSSAATYGAFAVYFSTLGNLGGYIFVTQAVSLLASLGISVGGTSAAVSTVAALGGPMTLVVALAIIVGVTLSKIVGGSWQRTLAKQIVKGFNKPYTPKPTEEQELTGKNYKQILLYSSDKYWQETADAVNLEMFNADIEKQERELKEQASQDPEELKKSLNGIKQFLF